MARTYGYPGLIQWHSDIILFSDPEELGNTSTMDKVDRLLDGHARIYALVSPAGSGGQRQNMAIWYATGPVIYSRRRELGTVKVEICPLTSCPAVRGLDGLEYKRRAYWLNGQRNDAIAGLARAAAGRDMYTLWATGVLLHEPEDLLQRYEGQPWVVVLVEGTEHGRELLKRLPGWTMQSGQEETGQAPGAGCGSIATLTYATEVGIHADILVRADGDTAALPVQGTPPERDGLQHGDAIIIDFDDSWDVRARENLRRRLEDYANQGWLVRTRNTGPGRQAGSKHAGPESRMVTSHTGQRLQTRTGDTGPGSETVTAHAGPGKQGEHLSGDPGACTSIPQTTTNATLMTNAATASPRITNPTAGTTISRNPATARATYAVSKPSRRSDIEAVKPHRTCLATRSTASSTAETTTTPNPGSTFSNRDRGSRSVVLETGIPTPSLPDSLTASHRQEGAPGI